MVGAADCRSAGPWFNSGWKSWFTFVTGSNNLMNHPAQRYNIMSPIRTVIATITRKSVNKTEHWKRPRRESLGRSRERSKSLRSTSTTNASVESNTKQGTLSELAERLGNFHESANALTTCLQTRDTTRKTGSEYARGRHVHVLQIAGGNERWPGPSTATTRRQSCPSHWERKPLFRAETSS